MPTQATIAVVGGSGASRAELVHLLNSCGFERVSASESLASITRAPDVLLVPSCDDAAVILSQAREGALWHDVVIIAVAAPVPPDAAAALLSAGADDVVREPPVPALLGARIRNLVRRQQGERRLRDLEHSRNALRHIQSLVSEGGDSPEALREVMMIVTQALGFERGALIAHVESSDLAYVIAATDDPTLSQFVLSIAKYPELAAAARSNEPVLIADALDHPITADVAEPLRARGVRGIAVFPCSWRRRGLGALLFRKSQPGIDHLTPGGIELGTTLAGQVAAQLRDSHVVERLTEDTRRISRASYEAERRLRTIESLKEHFEASADGVVVLDDSGCILFVNGAAESITGFARDGLVGSPLVDLVPHDQRGPLEEVIRSVLGGTNLEAFDLDIGTTSGEPICVSVTTSTVLARSGAVILAFRDVTAERALEGELQQTKDFLEKLIDSAVDSIVAADMHGRIILFNPGAERVFGHSAADVIGRLPIWRLYPDGVARRIMQMLRASSHGGVGRLEQTRLEVLTASGELVPVNMTASIIYEQGREAATVGILSDLRERLRMEQRLLNIQEQLELQERQAMVAQLAGAAAHELNQPLTSILGYAQLIERQSEPDAPHGRALQIILREVARMADIVRQIGRITRYETKEYVGSASIMDLERSAASSTELPAVDASPAPEMPPRRRPSYLDESGEITVAARDLALGHQAEFEDVVEPVEDEITAQHLILARTPSESDASEPPDEEELTPQPTRSETGEPSADRIGPTDAPISKRSG
jgi:PAS domain S-box-containing protein